MTDFLSPAEVERWLADMAKPADYQGYCCEGHFDRQHALEQFVRAQAADEPRSDEVEGPDWCLRQWVKYRAVARLLVAAMDGGGDVPKG